MVSDRHTDVRTAGGILTALRIAVSAPLWPYVRPRAPESARHEVLGLGGVRGVRIGRHLRDRRARVPGPWRDGWYRGYVRGPGRDAACQSACGCWHPARGLRG